LPDILKDRLINKVTDNFDIDTLIVDDEVDICYLLSGILRKYNYHPYYVTTLKDAEKALSHLTPALIFIDNHLPDGFGVDFLTRIKRDRPGSKVIMISAYDTNEDKTHAYENGVDYFIGKPFTSDIIFKAIQHLTKKHD
jgi:DNA-binding response OmpR family regulator